MIPLVDKGREYLPAIFESSLTMRIRYTLPNRQKYQCPTCKSCDLSSDGGPFIFCKKNHRSFINVNNEMERIKKEPDHYIELGKYPKVWSI